MDIYICVCDCLVRDLIIYLPKPWFQTETEPLILGSDWIVSKFWTDRIGSEISRTVGFRSVLGFTQNRVNPIRGHPLDISL